MVVCGLLMGDQSRNEEFTNDDADICFLIDFLFSCAVLSLSALESFKVIFFPDEAEDMLMMINVQNIHKNNKSL